jgi:hypothetical protein
MRLLTFIGLRMSRRMDATGLDGFNADDAGALLAALESAAPPGAGFAAINSSQRVSTKTLALRAGRDESD